METTRLNDQLMEIAYRIREMREISGFTKDQMAEKTQVSLETYEDYEAGRLDLPFTFIHKCALAFNIGITDLLEGESARLSSYNVVRRGQGQITAKEDGIEISSMAPFFRSKIAQPYWVRYDYSETQQNRPIHLTTHNGQEFDLVMSGSLMVQVGDHVEILHEGDSIYYNSSTPHGMIAVDGKSCLFCAVVLPGEDKGVSQEPLHSTIIEARKSEDFISNKYVTTFENVKGQLSGIRFENTENFNFAFDIVDEIARKNPTKLALLHVTEEGVETRFTFKDMVKASNRCANYFKSIGIRKGDKVMLVLKRHYQFWFAMLALHKLGAIAIPATYQLQSHDYNYRFKAGEVGTIICTADGDVAHQVDIGSVDCPLLANKIIVGGEREGWRTFDDEYPMFSSTFARTKAAPGGNDPMIMFFTSGTSGYPKMALHSYTYALGHFATAKYWHQVHSDGLHLTISDTGWGKALWGKFYGQWLCEAPVAVFEFEKFNAAHIMPMLSKYNVTTFCAPPTIYRMMIREDLSKYDFSTIKNATTAGEALNPEVFNKFKEATGLSIMEGFGQTESTLLLGNTASMVPKSGSMGKPMPPYEVDLVDEDGQTVDLGVPGEICVHIDKGVPCGLFLEYFHDPASRNGSQKDHLFHTGDLAWRDEDGYYWYIGRKDDVIKSSGYRIGPFEIENVIMELPYVLECGVSAFPDDIRGQVVKASIVLVSGVEGTEELKKEIQNYVKTHTAPYKYPRIVEFKTELPKTISGKIIRRQL